VSLLFHTVAIAMRRTSSSNSPFPGSGRIPHHCTTSRNAFPQKTFSVAVKTYPLQDRSKFFPLDVSPSTSCMKLTPHSTLPPLFTAFLISSPSATLWTGTEGCVGCFLRMTDASRRWSRFQSIVSWRLSRGISITLSRPNTGMT